MGENAAGKKIGTRQGRWPVGSGMLVRCLPAACCWREAGLRPGHSSQAVLVSGGIELIFFLVTSTACFGFSVRIMLITR